MGMLLLDLGVFSKNNHKVGFMEALIWSAVWITFSLAFYFFIIHYGDWIHGIDNMEDLQERIVKYKHPISIEGLTYPEAVVLYEKNLALEYLTGYIIEKSLSVDNIFVIIMIFYAFGVDEKYYKRVLMWGIIGAVNHAVHFYIYRSSSGCQVRMDPLRIWCVFGFYRGKIVFWQA